QRDADALSARRIIVTCGIPDQDNARGDGMIDPDVVVGITVAGTRGARPRQRSAMRQRRNIKSRKKTLDRTFAGEAITLIDAMGGIEPYPARALRKHVKSDIAVDTNRLLVARPVVGILNQQPRQDMMQRIGQTCKARLTRDGRAASVGSDDNARRERVTDA